jgi:hypothetical protein
LGELTIDCVALFWHGALTVYQTVSLTTGIA